MDIVAGERWDKAIEEALESCQTLIVVLSPSSVESVNVMDEVSYALESGKRVVPVLSRTCDVPFRLRRVQHIDFVNDYDEGFKRLVRSLRHASGDAAAAPAPAARVEPPEDQASGCSGGRLGKQLAIGLATLAVLALASFLAFQSTQKGDDGSVTGETGPPSLQAPKASSPNEFLPCTEVAQLQHHSQSCREGLELLKANMYRYPADPKAAVDGLCPWAEVLAEFDRDHQPVLRLLGASSRSASLAL